MPENHAFQNTPTPETYCSVASALLTNQRALKRELHQMGGKLSLIRFVATLMSFGNHAKIIKIYTKK